MMSRAEVFESVWAGFEDAWETGSEPPAPGRAERGQARLVGPELALAGGMRVAGEATPDVDLDDAWAAIAQKLERCSEEERVAPVVPLRPRRRRLVLRGLVAAAAAVTALAGASLHAAPGSPLYGIRRAVERTALVVLPDEGALRVRLAAARLGDLESALQAGHFQLAPSLARSTVSERRAAIAAGADVAQLDPRIASELPPLLSAAPSGTEVEVRAIFGGLLPPGSFGMTQQTSGTALGPGPTPAPSPSASGRSSGDRSGDGVTTGTGDGSGGSGDHEGSGAGGSGSTEGTGDGSGDTTGGGGDGGSGDGGSGDGGSGDASGSGDGGHGSA